MGPQLARPYHGGIMPTRSLPAHPIVLSLLGLGLLVVVVLRVWAAAIWPIPLSVDEAQYLVWSRDLQMGYYSKPPFIAWVLSLASWSCGAPSQATGLLSGEGCVRWLQPLAIGLASLFVYATAQRLFDRPRVGLWAAVLFALAPLTSFYSQAATTDAWLLLWWSAALWAFVEGLHHDQPRLYGVQTTSNEGLRWWVACGLFAGLGLLTKYSMAVFALSALWVLAQRRRLLTPGPWVCAAVALLVFTPNLIWNAHWGWPTMAHHADITVGQDHGLHPAGLIRFFASQWGTVGPLVFGMFLWGSLRRMGRGLANRSPYDQQTTEAIGLLLRFAWPMLLVVMLQSLLSRAHANWASPALVGISLVVAAWWLIESASRGHRLSLGAQISLWLSLLINLTVCGLLMASPWLTQAWGLAGHRQTDPFVRLTGYKAVAQAVSSLQPLPILASDDRKLLANLSAYLPGARVYAWNPRGEKDNHWQLQQDLRQLPGSPRVLLIQTRVLTGTDALKSGGPGPSGSEAQPRTEPLSEPLTEPLAQTHPDVATLLEAIRLEGKHDLGVSARWFSLAQDPAQ